MSSLPASSLTGSSLTGNRPSETHRCGSPPTALRIGVIETGQLPDELAVVHEDYVRLMQCWLGPSLPEAAFVGYRVVRGEPMGAPEDCDGYVITGSRHGAYEPLPWIPVLEGFIRDCAAVAVPVFGVCFGHQVMAQAFGATVRRSDRGWGCGRQEYRLEGEDDVLPVHVWHQDQVESVPDGAEVVGGNEFCPIGALRYPAANGFSVQFHPEFEDVFVRDLLRVRGRALPPEVVEAARRSLRDDAANRRVGDLAARFFRAAVVSRSIGADAGEAAVSRPVGKAGAPGAGQPAAV